MKNYKIRKIQNLENSDEKIDDTPTHYQSEEEYHSGSEPGLIPPNEPKNNLPLNMTFDANAAQALTLVLTNLNVILAGGGRENKSVNYSTFSERGDEDIDDFMLELTKAFTVNQVPDNRKHIVAASCLKGIAANFYDGLAGITRWNVVGQLANT